MATQPLGLLSGEEIESLQLVENGDADLYRASTYDLSIGEIVPTEPTAEGAYKLPPGGTVRVVSKESVKLPDYITGHALLKNELCRQGVLAINIGVIDPGFQGPISSLLINFGRRDFLVKPGSPFMRISFHRCPPSPEANKSPKYTRQQYLSAVQQEVAAYIAPTFLNIDVTARRAAKRVLGTFQKTLLLWATGVTVLIALLAIFAPLGASIVDKWVAAREQSESQLERALEKRIDEHYETRLKTLSDQIEELRRTPVVTLRHGNAAQGRSEGH